MRSAIIASSLLASLAVAIPASPVKRDPQVISNAEWVVLDDSSVGLAFDSNGIRTTRTMGQAPTVAPVKRDPQVITNANWVVLPNGSVGLAFDQDGVRTTRTDMGDAPTPAPVKRDPQVIENANWLSYLMATSAWPS